MHMTVTCPQCSTDFPVDPGKVPDSGVFARCSICPEVFRVDTQSLVAVEQEEYSTPPASVEVGDAVVDMEIPADVNTNEFGERELTFDDTEIDEPAEVEAAIGVDTPFEVTDPDLDSETPDAIEVVDEVEVEIKAEVDDPPPVSTGFETGFEVEVEAPAEPETEAGVGFEVPSPGVGPVADAPAFEAPEATPTLEPDGEAPSAPEPEPEPEVVAPPVSPGVGGGASPFGRRSPADRAKSLARSLVSDIIAYHSEKHTLALATGSLQTEFADEIEKSWKEYCEQVPQEVVESESFFNQALNEILAQGAQIFDHQG